MELIRETATRDKTGRITRQVFKAPRREFKQGCDTYAITVSLRFDDQCKNGHETFSITGNTYRKEQGVFRHESGGCIHQDIAEHFPELAHLIKWHLVSTDGPLHYIANTVYHAGDRDHNGLRKGERRQIRNGRTGKPSWILRTPSTQYHDGDAPPAETVTLQWEPWCLEGEGKARDLSAARACAVWPDATDAELSQEPEDLKAELLARLPALLAAFKADMLAIGFEWPETVAEVA